MVVSSTEAWLGPLILSLSLLDFWAYEIQWLKTTALISLPAHSNIRVSSGLISIDWPLSLWWAIFFGFFVCLVTVAWVKGVVNVTKLSVGYFCIPVNIPELCSGVLLRSSEMLGSFGVFLLRFVRLTRVVLAVGLIISLYWGKTLLYIIPNAPCTSEVFQHGYGELEQAPFTVLCDHWGLVPLTFRCSFPQIRSLLPRFARITTRLDTVGEGGKRECLGRSLRFGPCATLSCQALCTADTQCPIPLRLSAPSP